MEKKKFEEAEIKIITFEHEDIIATSGGFGDTPGSNVNYEE